MQSIALLENKLKQYKIDEQTAQLYNVENQTNKKHQIKYTNKTVS